MGSTEVILGISTAILVLVTLLPLSRCEHWIIRSLDFPRLQFSVALLIVLAVEVLLLDLSSRFAQGLLVLGILCLLYQFWWIFAYSPLVRKEVRTVSTNGADTVRVLTANVLAPNRRAQALLDMIYSSHPDLVVTLESDDWWEGQLDVLTADFPYSVKCPKSNLYGMHVYSKLKLSEVEVNYLVEQDVPSIHALLHLRSGLCVQCHFVHPAPPSPTENASSSERDAELVMIAKSVAQHDKPTIVTGDLNDVAWSKTTRLFRKISGLLDPRIGRGMFNTFHAQYWFLRWPLDHIFHSKHFGLAQLRRLGDIHSDHFPLLSELVYIGEQGSNQSGLDADQEDHEFAQKKMAKQQVSPEQVPKTRTPDKQ